MMAARHQGFSLRLPVIFYASIIAKISRVFQHPLSTDMNEVEALFRPVSYCKHFAIDQRRQSLVR